MANDDTIASLSELGNEKDVADPVKGFPKVSAARLEADLNTEFLSLQSGYDTAKTRRMTFWPVALGMTLWTVLPVVMKSMAVSVPMTSKVVPATTFWSGWRRGRKVT